MSLYELTQELVAVNNELISNEGEITPELEAKLNAIALPFREKALSIGKWTLTLASAESEIDAEIKRLQARKKVTANLSKRLTDYIKTSMEQADMKKIDTPTLTLAIQKNPPSAEVISEEMIPSRFKRIVQTITIDKKEILEALKEGYEVSGCKLVDDKTHLRIK